MAAVKIATKASPGCFRQPWWPPPSQSERRLGQEGRHDAKQIRVLCPRSTGPYDGWMKGQHYGYGPAAMEAMKGKILAQGEELGLFTQNPAKGAKVSKKATLAHRGAKTRMRRPTATPHTSAKR